MFVVLEPRLQPWYRLNHLVVRCLQLQVWQMAENIYDDESKDKGEP